SIEDVINSEIGKACFPAEVLASGEEDSEGGSFDITDATATGTLLGDDSKWTHQLDLTGFDPSEGDVTVKFVISDQKIAFASGERSASISLKDGAMRFENFEMKYGRHTRIMIKGDVNEDGSFSQVDFMEAIHTEQNNESNDDDEVEVFGGTRMISVKGDTELGFAFHRATYECNDCSGDFLGGEWQQIGTACLGTDECLESNAMVMKNDDDAAFLISETAAKEKQQSDWSSSHGPLCYDGVGKTFTPDDSCEF
ncbi:hypothetical protein N9D31_04320, partial [Oligoflexaceae bacterium]|nr:hypothetical protein [Oligoflexaceae bacterium]